MKVFFLSYFLCLQVEPAFLREKEFAFVPFVIQKAYEKSVRQLVVFIPCLYAFGFYASHVKPEPVACVFNIFFLHLYKILAAFFVFAEYIEYNFFAFLSFSQKLGWQIFYARDFARQYSYEKVVEQSHEQRLSAFAAKHSFKRPVAKQRGVSHRHDLARACSFVFSHNPPRGKKIENQKFDAKNIAPSPALECRKRLNHDLHHLMRIHGK
jgi:hypothetical protein